MLLSRLADDARRQHEERTLDRRRVAVRVNSVSTKFFEEDMAYVVSTALPTLLAVPRNDPEMNPTLRVLLQYSLILVT